MIGAIVLAAGASSRMGRPKAALPLGRRGHTVLSMGVSALLAAGVPRVVVVAGAHPDAVRGALGARDRRVSVIDHPAWSEGQLSTLLCGLEAIDHPGLEAVLVTLVDVPLVSPETVRALMREWRATGAPIVRPAQGDRHGHPVLFDRRLFVELRAADPRTRRQAGGARSRERTGEPAGDRRGCVRGSGCTGGLRAGDRGCWRSGGSRDRVSAGRIGSPDPDP